ncbi:MAG TPA: enterochelin esterase [Ktedonosporobacter sp.]|jgi:enterochelin esterase family protein|nr:enterochelin esterase [Ktedonosporobacter sp.]
MAEEKPLTSPRIAALEQKLTSGDTAALEACWQEVAERGTPLLEAIEGDSNHHLVTFLWRDTGDTHNVVVFAGPAGFDNPEGNQMAHMPNTDLWHKTYRVRSDLRTVYLLSANDPLTELNFPDDWGTRMKADPLNPLQFIYVKDDEDPDDKEAIVSVLELPAAPPQPWVAPRPGVAQGQVEMHRLRSDILDNERRVWVYTPPGYTTEGEPYGLLLVFDGFAYITLIPTPTILDNLISEGKIPPLVAVLPDSLNQETRNRELPCHQPFVDFLTRELLPWVHERYHVTSDPARNVVAGSSYGGLAATFVGLRASEVFGNVLSQSGSFWWNEDPEDKIPQEWLTRQFIASPRQPVHFYMEVGLQEKFNGGCMIVSNRHLRDILTLKGYEVYYTEYNGGHDYLCWRGSLADGLLALIGTNK